MTNPDTAPPPKDILIGVDVGGTFTDLVAFDGGSLRVVKVPSTPPQFDRAVVEAVRRAAASVSSPAGLRIVHGSTVATNALLQRAGEPVAFVTTEGFRDMLLIGRQNRPRLYALRVERPPPLTAGDNWFTARERIGAGGEVVEPLAEAEVDRLVRQILARGLRHVAVCLLFSFINPAHEQLIARRCAAAGLTVSLSSDVLPEFREYERASTTVINASLRPTVQTYLESLEDGLREGEAPAEPDAGRLVTPGSAGASPSPANAPSLRIMHSGGGTLSVEQAAASAAKLVLSGPAGGVLGAAFVARAAGFEDVITYDMGGTSTDVALVRGGRPQWTTGGTVDGLPIGLPAFDIVTVGAGGGSVAALDAGGALRVGPRSAGAVPGPACYGRGGTEPTVTDANLLLGRIVPDSFAGGSMTVDVGLARRAVEPLARLMGKGVTDAALGIVRVAEANMAHAVRAVTARRGHDPRQFALVSFGGAGGLHACAIADLLDVPRVLVPPYCGVLSALGMVVAPAVTDAARTVVHLDRAGQLDDARLAAEYGKLSGETMEQVLYDQTGAVEAHADARFRGQSHELKVPVARPDREHIERAFLDAYQALYGQVPAGRAVEVVTLRVRRLGRAPAVELPRLRASESSGAVRRLQVVLADGTSTDAPALTRGDVLARGEVSGPAILIDPEATAYLPPGWSAAARPEGTLVLTRRAAAT